MFGSRYLSITRLNRKLTSLKISDLEIKTTQGIVSGEIFSTTISGITFYLISGEPVSRFDETYSSDFRSDAEKFIFFSLACLQIPDKLKWRCDILHAHDWHTAVAIHHLKSNRHPSTFMEKTQTVLSVHNLPFMGTGSEEALRLYKVNPSRNKNLPAWARELPLPMGLAAADQIVAVSPTYAKEILTPEFGCDLQGFLQTRQSKVTGILNGINPGLWDPQTDTALFTNYDSDHIEKNSRTSALCSRSFNLTSMNKHHLRS